MIDPDAWLSRHPHVTVIETPLPVGEMGRWVPASDTICLAPGLSEVERRCTLVHELVHRSQRDEPELSPYLAERQEKVCRARSARILISVKALSDALMWSISQNEDEMAEALNVDIATLRDRLEFLTPFEREFMHAQFLDAIRNIA